MKGPGGWGRYDDDPAHVGCPYAKSDMTPCISRDGHLALAGEPFAGRRVCVGCEHTPAWLLADLGKDWEPARGVTEPDYATRSRRELDDPDRWADTLTRLIREATEPVKP